MNLRLTFFVLLSALSSFSQQIKVGGKVQYLARSKYIPVVLNDNYAVVFSPRTSSASSFGTLITPNAGSNVKDMIQQYDDDYRLIKYDLSNFKETIKSYECIEESNVVDWCSIGNYFYCLNQSKDKEGKRLFMDKINYSTLEREVIGKEILSLKSKDTYRVAHFGKKGANKLELILRTAGNKGDGPNFYYLLLDDNLNVINQQVIDVPGRFESTAIKMIKSSDDLTAIVLSNMTNLGVAVEPFQGVLSIYEDTVMVNKIRTNPNEIIIDAEVLNVNNEEKIIAISYNYSLKRISHFLVSEMNDKNMEFVKAEIPEGWISLIEEGRYNFVGVQEYFFNKLSDQIFSLEVYFSSYHATAEQTHVKKGPSFIFKMDEYGEIEWSNILSGGTLFKKGVYAKFFKILDVEEFVYTAYTKREGEIVVNKLNKKSGYNEVIDLSEINPFGRNYILPNSVELESEKALFFIQNIDPDYRTSTRKVKPVLFKN